MPRCAPPVVLCLILCTTVAAQERAGLTLDDLAEQANAAYRQKEYAAFLARAQQAYELAPGNYSATYRLARAQALAGNTAEALRLLDRVVSAGAGLNAAEHPDFAALKGAAEFDAIRRKIEAARRPVNHSAIAFTVPDKELLPESLAYDPAQGAFYVGSTRKRKIVRVDRAGRTRDFIAAGQGGLWSVIGIKLDPARRVLWVNSTVTGNMLGHTPHDEGQAAAFKFDLATGRLIKRYAPADGRKHFFNDLALDARGDVFLTDMAGNAVYRIARAADRLEPFASPERFTSPNGIALSADGRHLFVASDEGVSLFDVQTGARREIKHGDEMTLAGIDGLYFYQGSLIAVQPGLDRVARYYLNERLDEVTRAAVVEAHHPMFMNPTTGVLAGDTFYYIANSQFGSFDEHGTLFPPERLFETVVLKAQL